MQNDQRLHGGRAGFQYRRAGVRHSVQALQPGAVVEASGRDFRRARQGKGDQVSGSDDLHGIFHCAHQSA